MVGENITCSANSNPGVDYYLWRDLTNGHLLEEGPHASSLRIEERWAGMGKVLMLCSVSNTVLGEKLGGSTTWAFEVSSK